jgi:alpha-D-ribose 1-methylphosphonate 5-triphosphate synthase subunit PhnI
MAYVAARGGEQAILHSEGLHRLLTGPLTAETVRTVEALLPYLVDRVMGEGSLYAPELAALALAQTGGDLYEAVLLLRAYRSTQPRITYAEPVAQAQLHTVRRISAAFKDIPGGQTLGPSLDYSHRLLRLDLLDDRPPTTDHRPPTTDDRPASATPNDQGSSGSLVSDGAMPPPTSPPPRSARHPLSAAEKGPGGEVGNGAEHANRPTSDVEAPPSSPPAVADWQRAGGLLPPLPDEPAPDPARLPDVTREPAHFPAPRAHRLQALARADTGGVLALGYASMRGYGLAHPTVNELRLGYADVTLRHPVTGGTFSAGRVRVSQCEVVSTEGAEMRLGYTATLGWNEVKCIAGAMLDLEMSAPAPHPAHSEEFVLYHTEPVEASGFCIHYKLPHYVTFQSGLDALRAARAGQGEAADEPR